MCEGGGQAVGIELVEVHELYEICELCVTSVHRVELLAVMLYPVDLAMFDFLIVC